MIKDALGRFQLTVVDLFGTILPGAVWLLLFLVGANVGSSIPNQGPARVLAGVIAGLSGGQGLAKSAVLIAASVLIGAVVKITAMPLCEVLSRPEVWPALLRNTQDWRLRIFPYGYAHNGKAYVDHLERRLETALGIHPSKLPSLQPIVTCHRYLRGASDAFWSDAQTREAESRLTGSLFLAAVFSAFLAVVQAVVACPPDYIWLLSSVTGAVVLGYSFRKARVREVTYMYVDAVIALSESAASGSTKSQSHS